MPSFHPCSGCGRRIRTTAARCIVCVSQSVLATEQVRRQDYTECPLVTGNVAVISDVHTPLHDAEWLAQLMDEAAHRGIRKLVVGGDLMDWNEISRFMKDRPDPDLEPAVKVGIAMLAALADQFKDGIWVCKGNHELRAESMIEQATIKATPLARWLTRLECPELRAMPFRDRYTRLMTLCTERFAGKKVSRCVHWLPSPMCEIEGPQGKKPWRIIHQKNGSTDPAKEAVKHWNRWLQPIIVTHTHLWGCRFMGGQNDPLVQLGMGTREELHEYTWREPNGYPTWVRGFGLIVKGALTLFSDSPHLSSVGG